MRIALPISLGTNVALALLVLWIGDPHCKALEAHVVHRALHARSLAYVESIQSREADRVTDLLRPAISASAHNFSATFESRVDGEELWLSADGSYGAKIVEWGRCAGYVAGLSSGSWSGTDDQVRFIVEDDSGRLADTYTTARWTEDHTSVILPSGNVLTIGAVWSSGDN